MNTMRTQTFDSPIGPLTAGAGMVDGRAALISLEFGDSTVEPTAPDPSLEAGFGHAFDSIFGAARSQLLEYFAGERTTFDLPLHLAGTEFQRRVWDELLRIPFGETRSYADIARAVGSPGAVRAVGAANGRNPVAIIVPCHRVISSAGQLHGYGGGLERKARLLELEGAMPALFV